VDLRNELREPDSEHGEFQMSASYRELRVWQNAMGLVVQVYEQTRAFPKEEMYGLTSQMRRAAVSIPSNIAEGKGRSTDRDRSLFLCHARGSLLELETQVSIAERLAYLAPVHSRRVAGRRSKTLSRVSGWTPEV
jgi:four helix bundle protein